MIFSPFQVLFLENLARNSASNLSRNTHFFINPFRIIGPKSQPPGTLLNMIFPGVATVSVLNLAV
jgi:hypothetical protein